MAAMKHIDTEVVNEVKVRTISDSNNPVIFADIYQDLCNMTIWRRTLTPDFILSIANFLKLNKTFQMEKIVSPETISNQVYNALHGFECAFELSKDITNLVGMFCDLFEQKNAGLRLVALDRTMCPRFHVDRVPCRLITTYQGRATEWLENTRVDRTKLGSGNNGFPDEFSGIYQNAKDIQKLNHGDVALIKGELWEGNENTGLVHRSPSLSAGEIRLFLTLDFVS